MASIRDNIYTEREEGRMEGCEEGRAESLREASLNNARNLKKLGVAIDVIFQNKV